jgi:hypothetical protein
MVGDEIKRSKKEYMNNRTYIMEAFFAQKGKNMKKTNNTEPHDPNKKFSNVGF